MTLHVGKPDDWQALAGRGLDVVVDPMVVRCGEFFLAGAAGARDPAKAWDLLKRNVHALGLFFDALILEDYIPVFNYGDTFDAQLNFDQRVLAIVNNFEHVLYDVNVDYGPYMEIKSAALGELRKLYAGSKKISGQTARDIVSEMVAAEYHWAPHLGDLEEELSSDVEKNLARYFLGGLIFGAYAQILGGEHVVQPKRSRLFLAASFNKPADQKFEEELFGELKSRGRSSVTELPWRPTFFPYLLSVSEAPEALLTCAMKLRQSNEVREYRDWMQAAVTNWERDGHLGRVKKEMRMIIAAIDQRLTGNLPVPKVEIKVDVADVVALGAGLPNIPGQVDFAPTLSALWGWFFENLPGRRYRKLLIRAMASDYAYVQIENRIKSVWEARG